MSRKYGDLMIFFWERQEQAPKFKILKRNCIKNLTCNVKQKKKEKRGRSKRQCVGYWIKSSRLNIYKLDLMIQSHNVWILIWSSIRRVSFWYTQTMPIKMPMERGILEIMHFVMINQKPPWDRKCILTVQVSFKPNLSFDVWIVKRIA
jgi:hypothetical protein